MAMQTFLFTDVEGSTRLWENFPTVMGVAIARQEQLVRDATESHGGSVFNTAGDGICAVFTNPRQAVIAAIEAQRALLTEPWESLASGLRIAVRMGIDAGEAHTAGGNYLGPVLNQLNRLMKSGHGGQLLCSSTIAGVGDLGSEIELRDLGSHVLRDVADEVRIFQIVAPGLPDAFPRLGTERPRLLRLPYQPATVFGRENELQNAWTLLHARSARLVTLVGPGGVGKTTIAVALARRLDTVFADGVQFVDLSAIQDDILVIPTIAGILEIEDPLLESEEALIAGLRTSAQLIVLDNCEQVASEVARLVGRLLTETERLSILATSRIPLRLRGEHELHIEPLPLPDSNEEPARNPAVQLFVECARQVNSRFTLNDATCPAVVEICQMVDGLPLAIELAAAWVRILDPITLRSRLAEGVPLLRGDIRDRPERHRTLTSTIDWSYRLLDPAAQEAFGRLAIFQGSIPFDGALAILQIGNRATLVEALEQIDRLVQASLLRPPLDTSDGPHYQMLQTIHEFALGMLLGEEHGIASRTHATYFSTMAMLAEEHYRGPDAALWFARLDANIENLRTAFTWLVNDAEGNPEAGLRMATALWEYFDVRGLHRETRGLLSQAIAAAPHAPASERARALALLGNAWLSNYEQAETFYRRSLAIAAQNPDDDWQMTAALGLGAVALMRGDFGTALSTARDVLARCRISDDDAAIAQALLVLGQTLEYAGRFEAAINPLDESAERSARIGDITGIAWVHRARALALFGLGELTLAEDLLRQAIMEFEEIGERVMIAYCQLDLTRVLLRAGKPPEFALISQAIDEIAPVADVFMAPTVLDVGAGILLLMKENAAALELLGASDGWRRSTGTVPSAALRDEIESTRNRAMQPLEVTAAAIAYERGRTRSLRDAMLFLQARLHQKLETTIEHATLPTFA